LRQFFLNLKVAQKFGLLFPRYKVCTYVLILTNTRLGYILGDSFTNSSGHPDCDKNLLWCTRWTWLLRNGLCCSLHQLFADFLPKASCWPNGPLCCHQFLIWKEALEEKKTVGQFRLGAGRPDWANFRLWGHFFFKLPLNTLVGFDLTTHNSSLLGGRRRRYQ
jgi:hypothetical protein